VNYRESLDYLYGLQRFGIKLGLENIRTLLERCGHPERGYGIIHVAGTNGKGSVSAALAAILQHAGYRTGLYTSPHLHSFTERIRVDGDAIAEDEVARITILLRSLAEGVPATFFEFTTAMALLHFQQRQVDFAILEVGMGGRLDATNVVNPRLCVITPICFDHAEHLGDNLAAIAREKGGIIKEKIPVIVGRQEPEALEVLMEEARSRHSSLFLFGRDFSPDGGPDGFGFHGMGLELSGLRPGLLGAHQQENLSLALAAAAVLRLQGAGIPGAALREGIERVRWPGRLEWWGGRREVLIDGAHNEGGARVLAAYLSSLPITGVRWVAGIKGIRPIRDILGPLLPHVSALYCTRPPVEESVDPELLAEQGAAAGISAEAYETPEAALAAALRDRRRDEIVLVAGSLFLAAAAREFLQNQEMPSA
jgi:dihydrofolate synthase/folylpolyglutamate synthase